MDTHLPQHGKIRVSFIMVIFFILLSSPLLPGVKAQPSNNSNNDNGLQGPYANFSPSMAIIIVVLVAALFFMGFFSIYIRHCSDANSGNTVRNALSMRGGGRRANAASRGLDLAVIETFPTFTYAEVKDHKVGKNALECAVCLNEFEDHETLRLIPKCDHVFHPGCIDAWLESHVTCPVCRANLTPQPGDDSSFHLPEVALPETQDGDGAVSVEPVQVVCEEPPEVQETVRPQVNRNYSFDNTTRASRTGSIRRGRGVLGFGRFRSHSTGHSLVQPGENVDRFTLRLPEEKRKEMMNRALLNRTKSIGVPLRRNGSSIKGYKAGGEESSSKGARSYRRIEPLDRTAQSDRWVFTRASSFFSRALSIRSPRVTADNGEGSSSSKTEKTAVKLPSFKCLEPQGVDEKGLVASDSTRPPV